jgi:prepilin-type N-terminal cleavage/methylation domain-containing protein
MRKNQGFSMAELMIVIGIMLILVAVALPTLSNFQGSYRLHSDSGALASYLSVVRMRAASQYTPYRLDVDPTANTYVLEQLTQTSYNPFGIPGPTNYSVQSPAVYESGTQYLDPGNTVYKCRPSGITVFPPPVTANPSTCSGPFYFYFNTQGLPVDNTGSALASGGVGIYIKAKSGLLDAVTVSSGGAVQAWNYSTSSSAWVVR